MFWRTDWIPSRIVLTGVCALMASLWSQSAPAAVIDVSLNVTYANPANPNSGGTWELFAKSDGSGISGLSLNLSHISTAAPTGPRGTVNGGDPAGFSVFADSPHTGYRNITIGQAPIAAGTLQPGEEQSIFYGVGTITKGAPNYSGRPADAAPPIGPMFTSLTNVAHVPWADPADVASAFVDPNWATAAKLLSGTFSANVTPGFFVGTGIASTGSIFSTVGSSTVFGSLVSVNPLTTTIVRTNLIASSDADYNNDGTVNAADYTVWRNLSGMTGSGLAADGTGPGGVPDGTVNQLDYQFWKDHYGQTVPGSGSGSSLSDGFAAVPEPSSGGLLLVGSMLAGWRSRRSGKKAGLRRNFRATAGSQLWQLQGPAGFCGNSKTLPVGTKKATLEVETA